MKRILLYTLFLIGNFYSCLGQSTDLFREEQQLRKEMNDWMKPYRREKSTDFGQWIKHVEKLEPSALEHPVYKYIDSFYQQHRQQYLRLRKADLARYKPAPKLLPGYEYVPVFRSTYGNIDFETKQLFNILQRVGNFRTLSLADSRFGATALSGVVINYLMKQQGMSDEEVSHKFTCGEVPFADLIQGNEWQITFINRLYALKFNWDIENNQYSDPQLWVYTGGKQPAGWLNDTFPKANTAVQKLYRRLNTFRWSLYDQTDSTNVDYSRQARITRRKLTEFYPGHRKAYIKLRNEELAQYPPIDEIYAKAFPNESPELKEEFLTLFEKKDNHYFIPGFKALNEIDGAQIRYSFYYWCMTHSENFDAYNIAAWVGGPDVHTKKLAKDTWEIQTFYQHYTLNFHWNVATDEISALTIRMSKIDTPPEETKGIMVKPAGI